MTLWPERQFDERVVLVPPAKPLAANARHRDFEEADPGTTRFTQIIIYLIKLWTLNVGRIRKNFS